MRRKAYFSGLPTSQELATHQLGLFTKQAAAGAGCFVQLDEMQNKAEAQPAWLQLAAWAAAGA